MAEARYRKEDFLRRYREARHSWDVLRARTDPARWAEPGAAGSWSVKDVMAHIAWYEREMIQVLRSRAFVGSELWDLPQEERNAVVFERNRERPLADVRAEGEHSFAGLCAELERLTEQDLNDPARFPGMPAEWVPGDVFASNSYQHYEQHLPDLRSWAGGAPGGA